MLRPDSWKGESAGGHNLPRDTRSVARLRNERTL